MNRARKSYPSDVSDEEWAFCVRYLTLMTETAPQRSYPLREIFNALRYLVKMGGVWRMMPHDLPPWRVVYQQTQDRKSTRLNSSHVKISYAVFCLKKKTTKR